MVTDCEMQIKFNLKNFVFKFTLAFLVLGYFALEDSASAQTPASESLASFKSTLGEFVEKIKECEDESEKLAWIKLHSDLKVLNEKTPLLDLLAVLAKVRKSSIDSSLKDEFEVSIGQLVDLYFGPDPLDKDERQRVLETAKESQKWSHDNKLLGYRMGGDGSDGYIDCSHHVCKVYTDAGFEYSYLNVEGFVAEVKKKKKGESKFVELKPNQAKVGDVIVYLKTDGNPFNHMGVVSRVSETGEVKGVISATERGKLALNRDKESFKPSIVEIAPSGFQDKETKTKGLVTWRIFRWKEDL